MPIPVSHQLGIFLWVTVIYTRAGDFFALAHKYRTNSKSWTFSDTLSGTLSSTLSDKNSDTVFSTISYTLSGTLSNTISAILSDTISAILSGMISGTLFDTCSRSQCDIAITYKQLFIQTLFSNKNSLSCFGFNNF